MTRAREQIISLEATPYYHCMARCVRRAFLFGEDSVTGKRYDHRKQWVVDKLTELADIFCIDICAYAVMSNHYHLVLRIDADEAKALSNKAVLERWAQLFKGHLLVNRYLSGEALHCAEQDVVAHIAEECRKRLMDISWFMRVLNESIARRANEEDECRGRFWEGRFKSQALLDEAAILACMAYVDLNPVRAGMAKLPETSDFSSIQLRLFELASRGVGRPCKLSKKSQAVCEQSRKLGRKLLPFSNQEVNAKKSVDYYWQDYLELLDWTGRAILQNKRGSIPANAPKILLCLGIPPDKWLDHLPKLELTFHHMIGRESSLRNACAALKQNWVAGLQGARLLFAHSS